MGQPEGYMNKLQEVAPSKGLLGALRGVVGPPTGALGPIAGVQSASGALGPTRLEAEPIRSAVGLY